MSETSSRPLKAWLALLAVCIIWGTTYMANKVGVTHMPPLFFSALRQLLAGSLILGWFALRGNIPWADKSYFLYQAWLGILLISVGNGVGLIALQSMESGISSLLAASSPFMIVMFGLRGGAEERLQAGGWAGILLGMAGVAFLSWDEFRGGGDVMGWALLFQLIAIMGWSYGSVASKRRHWPYPVILSAGIQMLAGGLINISAAPFFEEVAVTRVNAELVWSLLYLVVFGSLVAYTSYLYALSKLPASVVALHSYINPLLALVVGWALLGERLDERVGISALLILGGVWLVNRDFLRKRRKKRKLVGG